MNGGGATRGYACAPNLMHVGHLCRCFQGLLAWVSLTATTRLSILPRVRVHACVSDCMCVCARACTSLHVPSPFRHVYVLLAVAAATRARSSLHPLSIFLVEPGLSFSHPFSIFYILPVFPPVHLCNLFRRVFLFHGEYQLYFTRARSRSYANVISRVIVISRRCINIRSCLL